MMKNEKAIEEIFRQLEEISLFTDEQCEELDSQLTKQEKMQNIFKY